MSRRFRGFMSIRQPDVGLPLKNDLIELERWLRAIDDKVSMMSGDTSLSINITDQGGGALTKHAFTHARGGNDDLGYYPMTWQDDILHQLRAANIGEVPLTIKLASGQLSNLFNITDNDGAKFLEVDDEGRFALQAPTSLDAWATIRNPGVGQAEVEDLNPVAWWAADDPLNNGGSSTPSNGQEITTDFTSWADITGNGHNQTAASQSPGSRPTWYNAAGASPAPPSLPNSNPCFSFIGGRTVLSDTFTTIGLNDFTIYGIVYMASGVSGPLVGENTNSGVFDDAAMFRVQTPNASTPSRIETSSAVADNSQIQFVGTNSFAADVWRRVKFRRTGSTNTHDIDGTNIAVDFTSNPPDDGCNVEQLMRKSEDAGGGPTVNYATWVAEIIIFNTALSAADQLIVEEYLDNKYGTATGGGAGSLPFVHLKDSNDNIVAEFDESGHLHIGGENPDAALEVTHTSEQMRVGYDASNYMTVTVGSTGSTTIDLSGTSPEITFNNEVNLDGAAQLPDGHKLFLGDSKDASIVYDGTNLIINPRLVGTGFVEVDGDADFKVSGTNGNIELLGASGGHILSFTRGGQNIIRANTASGYLSFFVNNTGFEVCRIQTRSAVSAPYDVLRFDDEQGLVLGTGADFQAWFSGTDMLLRCPNGDPIVISSDTVALTIDGTDGISMTGGLLMDDSFIRFEERTTPSTPGSNQGSVFMSSATGELSIVKDDGSVVSLENDDSTLAVKGTALMYGGRGFAGGSAYLTMDGVQYSTVRGVVAIRSGSIVGISAAINASVITSNGAIQIEIHKNGSVVFSASTTITSPTTDYNCYATQDAGIDTFVAGDELQLYINHTVFVGSTAVFATAELVYDGDVPVNLDDLADVNAPAPNDGDVLTWDDGASEWVAAAGSGSTSVVATTTGFVQSHILISRQAGTGASGTISFTSIPGTYRHLIIRIKGRSSAAVTSTNVTVEFNSDTTSSNYRTFYNYGGTTHDDSEADDNEPLDVTGGSSPSGEYATYEGMILEYKNTAHRKIMHGFQVDRRDTSTNYVAQRAVVWENTAAITRIDLILSSGNWTTDSVIELLGVDEQEVVLTGTIGGADIINGMIAAP